MTCNWHYVHGDGDVQLKLCSSNQDGVLVGHMSFQEKKKNVRSPVQCFQQN